MDCRSYLEQLRKLDILIRQRKVQLEHLKSKAYSPRIASYSGVKVKEKSKKDKNSVDYIIDLENQIDKSIVEFIKKEEKIISQIQSLENPLYLDIIFKRYVEFKPLEKIASEMDYSYNYIRRVHNTAVDYFAKCVKIEA